MSTMVQKGGWFGVLFVVAATVCGVAYDAAASESGDSPEIATPVHAGSQFNVLDLFSLSPEQFVNAVNQ
jgi:hypothetical protein